MITIGLHLEYDMLLKSITTTGFFCDIIVVIMMFIPLLKVAYFSCFIKLSEGDEKSGIRIVTCQW